MRSFFSFASFSFLSSQKRKENEELFWNKKVFWNILFFLFCCDKKISHFTSKLVSVPTSWKYLPQKSTKRKRKHANASYALASVEQNGWLASKACTLSLTIGATHVNILSASIIEIQNFIFSIQACLKVTFHVRTHVRGAIVVHLMKFIMDSSALGEQIFGRA